MCIRKRLFVLLASALPLSAAWACGPDFPQRLLDDRKGNLLALPEGTFYYEAGRLLPKPTDGLKAVDDGPDGLTDEMRAKADAVGLSAGDAAKVLAMRAAGSADAAAAAGAGLAPELLEYTLGAIAFKKGDHAGAVAHFKNVVALAPAERPLRGLWALYMLGRANAASGDPARAMAAFDTVRERAASGVADPLGLAVATYGEQARFEWHQHAVVAAVKLYAQQAAHGSQSGATSLLFVARSLLAHRELLDKVLDDPLTQRLLAAYLFTRASEFGQDWAVAGQATDTSGANGDGTPHKSATAVDVEGFLAAVEQHGLTHFDGADRLAAGAYNAGRYPLAARLAARADGALAAWVRAKLALRAGDPAGAQAELAKAAQGFPVEESWGGDPLLETVDSPRCRVESERGLLALGRDDYVEAMARLYAGASQYWPDAAYVAERVLTLEELKSFVDQNVPASKTSTKKDDSVPTPAAEKLRALLARRLMRAGRLQDALAYFDNADLRKKAQALVDAHHDDHAWSATARAAALYKQAKITRSDGMDLLGAELEPDNAQWDGEYPPDDLPATKGKDFVGHGEVARVVSSAIEPDGRFHYRYVAANMAEHAASMVAPRSQAYAAMMCHATQWMLYTDAASAARIYHRYQRNGAYVKWGKGFGSQCPEPDFESAKWLPYHQAWWTTRHWTRHQWPWLLIGGGVLVGLVAFKRRRAKS